MSRARSNLALARNRIPDAYMEDLCFEAQTGRREGHQRPADWSAVEFPYVHDIAILLTLLENAGQDIPESVRKAEALTLYAVVTRYLGALRPVNEQEHQNAVAIARDVIQWAEEHIYHE